MFCRAAEWNPSVFRPEGKEEIGKVIQRYLKLAIHYDYPFNIAKYCLQQLLGSEQDSDHGRAFLACATLGNQLQSYIKQLLMFRRPGNMGWFGQRLGGKATGANSPW